MCEGFIRRVMCVNQQRVRPISIQYTSPHKLTNRCVLPEMNINKKQIKREMATFAIKVPMLYDFILPYLLKRVLREPTIDYIISKPLKKLITMYLFLYP